MIFKKPFFIAEISANHNGSINRAKKLIKLAKKNGADAVKLQTYTPDTMTPKSNKDQIYLWISINRLSKVLSFSLLVHAGVPSNVSIEFGLQNCFRL